MSGGVEIQLQSLKFSSSKMKESKTRDCFWYFWLKSSLQKLGCRHIDDGGGRTAPSQVLSCQGTGTIQGRSNGRAGLSLHPPTSL